MVPVVGVVGFDGGGVEMYFLRTYRKLPCSLKS